MSKIKWDETGKRTFETGLDHGVLFPMAKSGYGAGVPWNGMTAVNESPSGAESNPLYADNIKYLNLMSAEDFGCTVEAYTYPDEFEACDGSAEIAPGVTVGQQSRKMFGLSYRTKIGNDVEGQDFGYKIHLVYGGLASPSEKNRQTVNDSPEAVSFSWEVTTTPVEVPGFQPAAHLTIDSTKTDAAKLTALEKILYGDEDVEARLPLPAEIVTLIGAAVSGPDTVKAHDATFFAHLNMKVDGNNFAAMDTSKTLDEHMRTLLAHQNIVIDGNL